MAKFNAFTFGAVALATLAATGCGKTALNAPNLGAQAVKPNTAVIQGVERKFGYDYKKFETVLAKTARPQHLVRQGALPPKADNRAFCAPVYDQGHLGSCTAFAMGKGMREYMAIKNKEEKAPLSALFLYYVERDEQGDTQNDTGATIDGGMDVLTRTGIAKEQSWPYDIAKFALKPPAEAYKEAAQFKIHDAKNLAELSDVKTALNAGQTVAFGFRVYESFRKVGADGMMPIPKPGEKLLGGHAVLAVGYDDTKKALIVRNSWGAKWADNGYFYMPYEVANNGMMVHEYWTASK